MKRINELPILFLIVGLILNIVLSLSAKVSFTVLMIRSIIVIILFTSMGFVLANVLNSALLNIKKSRKMKLNVKEEVATSSTFDIRVESRDEDEILKTLSQPEEDDFVEINPESFKRYMNQD